MQIARYVPVFLVLILAIIVLLSGCTSTQEPIGASGSLSDSISGEIHGAMTWMTLPITDTSTGNQFRIVDEMAGGKPVIIHTFAVWCPACTLQLAETTRLLEKYPDSYRCIALDIDPRENSEKITKHVAKNSFRGIFAVSPTELSKNLVDTFGMKILTSLPQTIVLCNNSATYIGDGVITEGRLREVISSLS